MTGTECRAKLNLLGVNCLNTYNLLNVYPDKDTFIIFSGVEAGVVGYLSYKIRKNKYKDTVFFDTYEEALNTAIELIKEKQNG